MDNHIFVLWSRLSYEQKIIQAFNHSQAPFLCNFGVENSTKLHHTLFMVFCLSSRHIAFSCFRTKCADVVERNLEHLRVFVQDDKQNLLPSVISSGSVSSLPNIIIACVTHWFHAQTINKSRDMCSSQ